MLIAEEYSVSEYGGIANTLVTSILRGCGITVTGLPIGCVTLYAPGPGVIKLEAGKCFVFKTKDN